MEQGRRRSPPRGNPVKIGNGPAAVIPFRETGKPAGNNVTAPVEGVGRLPHGRESQKTCLDMVSEPPRTGDGA